jgi:ATP-dependent helicase/DNAse subunit B
MPLKLVTGPANAAKAGEVLGGLRGRLDDEPLLVVPGFEDVEHNQRELAQRGAVFGARVVRFKHLFGLIARRTGIPARIASDLRRQVVLREAIAASKLDVLAASADSPGFARAAERFVGELERSMVDPARLTAALRVWAGEGSRRGYAEEIAELYRRYLAGLDTAELLDGDLLAWRAVEALAEQPEDWGSTPVFAYGFDDFTEVELRALELLAATVEVTVSLPYERDREAFEAVRSVYSRLAAKADEHVVLAAADDHYAEPSRPALHALERGLFVPGAPVADPGEAIRMHSAGGERAEVELCGAEVLRLLRAGTPAGEIAVVFRDPGRYASLLEQVFGAYRIPYSIDRVTPLSHTALGRGLLALLRVACLEGTTEDLLTYLRTPGLLRESALADRLESLARQRGVLDAATARVLWEDELDLFPLDEIDRLAAAGSPEALLEELERRLERLFAAPYRRQAHILNGPELEDPRSFHATRAALRQLAGVGTVAADPATVHAVLEALPVRMGERPQPDRVQVAAPDRIRARRFAVVIVCGLQEGEFPRSPPTDPFLSDADRRALASATGLVLPLRERELDRERYLFYVCASRAERELVLSSRYCDEEGDAQQRSFLLDDVLAMFPSLAGDERRRSLSDVTWEPLSAPTPEEWERAVALRGPRMRPAPVEPLSSPPVLAALGDSATVSASALERYASCSVKWLVEDVLRPERLEPDPDQMVRGAYAHKVLELTFKRLRERTGARRPTPATLHEAEQILIEALAEERGAFRLAPTQTRVRAAVRRLELDLLRYLRHEARRDGVFEPEHLELRFGLPGSEYPRVELESGLGVRGVIDRVDTWGEWALVRDYKGGRVESYKEADWERRNRFQVALYMLVVERLLGRRAAGGVYTPLAGTDRRSRGLVAAELAEELGSDFVPNDFKPAEEFAERKAWAQAAVAEVAAGMRAGHVRSCPDTCAWRGGCSYPSICRIEG